MIPNNNLSVLPIYNSIEQQNAKKWWIYGKVYPLFTPAGFLLPFQFQREKRITQAPNAELAPMDSDVGYIDAQGVWQQDVSDGLYVHEYDITQTAVYLSGVPAAYKNGVMAVAYDSSNMKVLGTFNPIASGTFTGLWKLPVGTKSIRVQVYNRSESLKNGIVYSVKDIPLPISILKVYDKDNNLVEDCSNRVAEFGFAVKTFTDRDYDVIVYAGRLPAFTSMSNGQYYLVIGDGQQEWYSEIFTVVNDISGYLKIEWWDIEDFEMDAGTIVYENPRFKNVLYLCSDIAKPEYIFDEEVIERDGYMFPVKQISEKRYRFSFLASEYLLDVMRFIRMSDYICITKDGQTYNVDSFLISPEWEDNGDIATVDAEFETATVAKKIGLGYLRVKYGDFNADFISDFNNQK